MNANIKLELKTLTPVKVVALMRNVAAKLDGNPHFPAPPVSPAALFAMADALTDAISLATQGSLQSKLQRNDRVAAAVRTLRLLADHARLVAQGDAAILASSGFELARRSGPPQPMGTPVLKAARMTGRHGEVELRWSGVANRRTYQVYITTNDPTEDTEWTIIGVTGKITHLVTDLEPYKAYWFCVSAIGALGEGARSNPIIGRAA